MIGIFLRGILMGICDLIPGISGGTIAFITGIYERLINAIKSFSFELVKDLFSGRFKSIKKLDLVFLIVLGAGIATAILLGSRVISFLLDNYFSFTIAFFIGLIIASSKVIFDHIEEHDFKNISFGFIGLVIGLILAFLIPAQVNPNIPYIFLSGFLAISAMFLPGISGAFILLILGAYEFMLGVLHDIPGKIMYFVTFLVGAVLGAFTISRFVSFLFKKDKCRTLYVLLGLVVGALSIPVKRVIKETVWNVNSVVIITVMVVLGVVSVVMVNKWKR